MTLTQECIEKMRMLAYSEMPDGDFRDQVMRSLDSYKEFADLDARTPVPSFRHIETAG